jgi:hypothetical protein
MPKYIYTKTANPRVTVRVQLDCVLCRMEYCIDEVPIGLYKRYPSDNFDWLATLSDEILTSIKEYKKII